MGKINVKTIFFCKKYIFLFLVISGLSLLALKYTQQDSPISFECSSDINIINKDSQGSSIVRLSFLVLKNGNGVITEYGIIKYNGESYMVNRNIKIKVDYNGGDYYEIKRGHPTINDGDNLPDSLYYSLVSKDKTLNYKINKIKDNLIIIRANKRTVFMCHASKKM